MSAAEIDQFSRVREWARRRMERKQLPEHDAKNLEALNRANAMQRWGYDPDCPHCEGTGNRITTTEDDEFLVRCDCRRPKENEVNQ